MNMEPSRLPLRRGSPSGQRGFTLVELSVAMLLALFLLGGVFALEQSTKQNYGNQTALAQLQDNQRLAMSIIGDVVQSAGYFPDPTADTSANAFPVIAAANFQTASQVVWGTHPNGTSSPGDTLYVRYKTASGDNIVLCDGSTNTTGAAASWVNEFSINNQNQLVCNLGNGALGANSVVLVNGVSNLQVWYGVKRNTATVDDNVDTYLTADNMTATDWLAVTAVEVAVTFVNPMTNQPTSPTLKGITNNTITFTRVIDLMNRAGVNTGDQ